MTLKGADLKINKKECQKQWGYARVWTLNYSSSIHIYQSNIYFYTKMPDIQ